MHKILCDKGYDVVIKINIKMINNYYFSLGKKPDKAEIENILRNAEKKQIQLQINFQREKDIQKI